MKRSVLYLCVGLLVGLMAAPLLADESVTAKHNIWLGAHYKDFDGYRKKISEYGKVMEEIYPEFSIGSVWIVDDALTRLTTHSLDEENINFRLDRTMGWSYKADVQYRSLTHQGQADLLENASAREWLGSSPGGKMLTHTLNDIGFDYSTHRQEIMSQVEILLSRQHDVKFMAAHRSILTDGHKQAIGSNHCFSCHLETFPSEVNKESHQVMAGLEGKIAEQLVGYEFGYRHFNSETPDVLFYYDNGRHPVNGGSDGEFSSRLQYDDTLLAINQLPEIQKQSHKLKSKGDIGPGHYNLGLFYNRVDNQRPNFTGDEFKTIRYGGRLKYAMLLSKKTRLMAEVGGSKTEGDEAAIDLMPFRGTVDFDYIMYSTLSRREFDASAEVITRLTPKITLSVLAGWDQTLRYNYPEFAGDYTTNKFIGQLKVRYRKGLRYSFRGKYRLEKIDDPFVSGRGLFEERGREALMRDVTPSNRFSFYHQREALRYQAITSEPTIKHELEIASDFKPNNKLTLSAGGRFLFDQNTELDSLDVEHTMFNPYANVAYTATQNVFLSGGYWFQYYKSRGPITVPLFDG